MGLAATRFLVENGVDVAGAIARRPDKVGRDLGELAGLGRKLGVLVADDADEVLSSAQPDIVLHATRSTMDEISGQLATCVRHGANVLTIAEEALYPWETSPGLAAELDALAREHGVTITGSGHQDATQVGMVIPLLGMAHRITSVHARQTWNADDYGADAVSSKHIGESVEDFTLAANDPDRPPAFGKNILAAVAAASGLTPRKWKSSTTPIVADEDRPSAALGRTLEAGTVIGYSDFEVLETEEGPTFTFEMSGYVYGEGESDVSEWTVTGEPDLYLSNGDVPTAVDTCTQWVNRIPDVLNAEPGFVTVDRLPPLRYRATTFPEIAKLQGAPA